MLPVALSLRPGTNTQLTALQNEGGVSQSNLIRHKNGLIQKQGGCQAISSSLFSGTARCLFPWQDLVGNEYLAIGTNQILQLYNNGNITDIMPIAQTDNLSAPFSTVMGSNIVTVADTGYAPQVDSFLNIINAMYVDGIVLQGLYQVISTGVNTYTIAATSNALTGVSGQGTAVNFSTTNTQSTVAITLGAATFVTGENLLIGVSTTVGGITFLGNYTVTVNAGPTYDINGGGAATGTNTGYENSNEAQIVYYSSLPAEGASPGEYGEGPYGSGEYGVGEAAGALNLWSMDKWGQNLIAAFRTGPVLQWVPPIAIGNVAVPLANSPQQVNGLFTAAPEQQIITFGAYSATISEQDPLLVAWCDIADNTDWTASATNQAGTFRLPTGSKIVSGMWAGTVGLLWTDIDFWIMTYVNYPLVYGFNQAYRNCGLISMRAAAIVGATIEWLSQNDFFIYTGGSVSVLPCSVRDFIFDNLDTNFLDAVYAAPNGYFDEITWWFPTLGSNGVCDSWVRHNVAENLWDCGPLPAPPSGFSALEVSAWTDQSVFGPPIGAFYTGKLEQFEETDDIDGAVYDSWLVTGWFQLAQGQEFIFLDKILPDFILTGTNPQIQVTVYVADYMNGPVTTYGPFVVTPTTQYFEVRARARLCQLRVDCVSPNTFWRYGKPLAVIAADGRN